MRTIVPIGFLYAGTLWLGNAAYIHLSVSFIQMLKVGQRCRHIQLLHCWMRCCQQASCKGPCLLWLACWPA